MKFSNIISGLALVGATYALPPSPGPGDKPCTPGQHKPTLPTTKIAGIEVVYTPLVKDAVELIKQFIPLQPYLYNHLMRSWLFGAAAFNNNATLKAGIDLELHAVGSLLHDLGWDMRPNSPWHSPDRVFEVDSGLGAVQFVKDHKLPDWDEARLERMYDGITLQGNGGYLPGKNLQTRWIVQSVEFEFPGPRSPLIRNQDYDSILAEFPNDTVFRGTNETFTWLALTKPAGTHGSFIDWFGVAYVPGYGEPTHLAFDLITSGVADEIKNYPDSHFESNI